MFSPTQNSVIRMAIKIKMIDMSKIVFFLTNCWPSLYYRFPHIISSGSTGSLISSVFSKKILEWSPLLCSRLHKHFLHRIKTTDSFSYISRSTSLVKQLLNITYTYYISWILFSFLILLVSVFLLFRSSLNVLYCYLNFLIFSSYYLISSSLSWIISFL